VRVAYRLFAGVDPQHRGILRVDDARAASAVAAPGDVRTLPLAGAATAGPGALSFVGQGIAHIWGGLDHVLFLLALLLPAVLRREQGRWVPLPRIRTALADVARIVTAFSAAHSLTLSLAALGLVRLPARITEPAIAASVVIAAVNNLRPLFGRDRWVVAFALGLLHGFGFSSVLADAGLPRARLLASLVGFNLGVELGQLAILLVLFPLLVWLRKAPDEAAAAQRQRRLVTIGSTPILLLGVALLVDRIFQRNWFP